MKKMSYWAKTHPKKAIMAITMASILGGILGLIAGAYLFIESYHVPKLITALFTAIFLLAALFYPVKGHNSGLFKHTYFRQKFCDFLVSFSGIVLMALAIYGIGHDATLDLAIKNDHAVTESSVLPFVIDIEIGKDKKVKRKMFRKHKKEIRKALKVLKKKYKEEGNDKGLKFVKFLLILLTIGAALLLGYLVAAWSCNLSCSGNDGAAAAVLIAGWGLIIYGGIVAFKAILEKQLSSK